MELMTSTYLVSAPSPDPHVVVWVFVCCGPVLLCDPTVLGRGEKGRNMAIERDEVRGEAR